MDDSKNVLRLKIQEINSSLIILQEAIQNNNQRVSSMNIDDYLEILIQRTSDIINSLND